MQGRSPEQGLARDKLFSLMQYIRNMEAASLIPAPAPVYLSHPTKKDDR